MEVTGPRGVGKSTFVGLVRSEFEKRQVDIDPFRPTGRAGNALFRLTALFGSLGTRSIWPRWRPVSRQELRVFQKRFWRYRYRLWRAESSPGIHVLDEGIYQLLLMLMVKSTLSTPRPVAERLREMVRFPDLVIQVSASAEEIRDRRKQRGNAGDLKKPELSAHGLTAMRLIGEYLEQLPSSEGRVLFVRSGDRDAVRRAAEEAVSRILELAVDKGVLSASIRKSADAPPGSGLSS